MSVESDNSSEFRNEYVPYVEPEYNQYITDGKLDKIIEYIAHTGICENKDQLIEDILYASVIYGKVHIARYILDTYKFDVNYKNIGGTTLLMCSHDIEMLEYLVEEKKCDVNLRDDDGCSALYWMGINNNPRDDINIIKYLLKHGAKVSTKSNCGYDALDTVMEHLSDNYNVAYYTEVYKLIKEVHDKETCDKETLV
jgi:hypothetical protein